MNRPVAANAVDAPARGWTASRHDAVERAVRTARRHSRLVRVVRVGLPVTVVAGAAALLFFTYLRPMLTLQNIPGLSGKLGVQGTKITMDSPRVAGITRESRSYELTADTAVQDMMSPDVLELQNLRITMEMPDKDIVNIVAKSGTYNSKADKMHLRDQVVVTSAQGYIARMREAAVDMKQGGVVSEQPMEITLPNGVLTANKLEITGSGDVIRFERGVVLKLNGELPAEAPK